MEERTCKGCHEKDTTVELRQNDLLMCDLCWGRPMSEDSIIYRNTLIMEDVDTGVQEKSPIVVKCVTLLTDYEAVPAILDVATPYSIVKYIKGWLISRQKSVKVYSFSGADTADMEHFLQPLINKEPDQIILHIGTNDVSNGVTVSY